MKRLFSLFLTLFLLNPVLGWTTNYTQDANIVGAWTMDIDEDPIDDVSANNNTVTLKGAGEPDYSTTSPPKTYSTGFYDWDGVNDYASTTATVDLSAGQKCSVVFWYNLDAADGDRIIIEMSGNFNNWQDSWIIFSMASEKMEMAVRGNATYNTWRTTTVFTAGTWYHVAALFDKSLASGEAQGYVNGSIDGATAAGSNANNTNNFGNRTTYFGSRGNASLFLDTKLDEVAIFNDILTSTEINDIMDNGLVGAVPALAPLGQIIWIE